MNCIGIILNFEKPEAEMITKNIIKCLERHGKKVIVAGAEFFELRDDIPVCPGDDLAQVDCIIVLGGDGTLLNSARSFSVKGIPLFGVNLGQLGFLTEIELPDLNPALEKLISGDFFIEERMMLQATIVRQGKEIYSFFGLNDAVITKGAFARIIRLKTFINEEFVDVFPADGLLVSTPTGSTGYSLSAGGPLVAPNLELMIVTPICPHTLYSRPIVIDKHSIVRVEVQATQAEVMLTMDGQSGFQLEPFDHVVIQRAPFNAKFMKLNQRSFYEILRAKLKESGNSDV
ncbi:NAD(+)/NADH kinase [Phosphitispora sp. TUW77]|uniref:NAD(+)/NADH kinase n=1 Tax=Phosphitispora sp. TUW77 TaxID=3152361 RepID=UPI003AB60AA3